VFAPLASPANASLPAPYLKIAKEYHLVSSASLPVEDADYQCSPLPEENESERIGTKTTARGPPPTMVPPGFVVRRGPCAATFPGPACRSWLGRDRLGQTTNPGADPVTTLASLPALYSFWVSQNAGLTPFAFYNPFDVASGQIGSNYDPTGNNTQGRVTVVFRGNWAQATDVARTNVQGLELVEVA
jgi:hypothetical protein